MDRQISEVCSEANLTPDETNSVKLILKQWNQRDALQTMSSEFSKHKQERQFMIVKAIATLLIGGGT